MCVVYLFRPHHRSARSNPLSSPPHPFFTVRNIQRICAIVASLLPLRPRQERFDIRYSTWILSYTFCLLHQIYINWLIRGVDVVASAAIGGVCANKRLLLPSFSIADVGRLACPHGHTSNKLSGRNSIHFGISLCNLTLISFDLIYFFGVMTSSLCSARSK